MASIGEKIKAAAMKAAKDSGSGGKKGKHARSSESGVDKAMKTIKNRLK